jgi:hypothetical protein
LSQLVVIGTISVERLPAFRLLAGSTGLPIWGLFRTSSGLGKAAGNPRLPASFFMLPLVVLTRAELAYTPALVLALVVLVEVSQVLQFLAFPTVLYLDEHLHGLSPLFFYFLILEGVPSRG